jgi:hypothetical protein
MHFIFNVSQLQVVIATQPHHNENHILPVTSPSEPTETIGMTSSVSHLTSTTTTTSASATTRHQRSKKKKSRRTTMSDSSSARDGSGSIKLNFEIWKSIKGCFTNQISFTKT